MSAFPVSQQQTKPSGLPMTMLPISVPAATQPAAEERNDPVTLHRVMQTMIADGLRRYYQPPQKLSHELFVLLLQLRDRDRRDTARPTPRKPRRARAPARVAL